MKKAANILFVLSWLFAIACGVVFFVTNGMFDGHSLHFAKATLLENIPSLINFADFNTIWSTYPATFVIFAEIVVITVILFLVELGLVCSKKRGKAVPRLFLILILACILAFEAVFFCYPGAFEVDGISTVDGYGLAKYAIDGIVNQSMDMVDGILMLLPVGLAALALIFFILGEIFQIASLGRIGKKLPEEAVPEDAKEEPISAPKEETKSTVVYADRHVTIQYFNNYGSTMDEGTLRRIIREELGLMGSVPAAPVQPAKVTAPVDAPIVKDEDDEEEPKERIVKPVSIEVVNPNADDEEKAKIVRIAFADRMKSAEKVLKNHYNELKSYIMAYGVNSRVSNSGDAFRLHTKTYLKITVAGKSLKLYMALNPKDYADSTIPVGDASKKSVYADIPLVFKVKSDLSLRRAKQLIDEAMAVDGLTLGEVQNKDWTREL